jgi:hypothetical protein
MRCVITWIRDQGLKLGCKKQMANSNWQLAKEKLLPQICADER